MLGIAALLGPRAAHPVCGSSSFHYFAASAPHSAPSHERPTDATGPSHPAPAPVTQPAHLFGRSGMGKTIIPAAEQIKNYFLVIRKTHMPACHRGAKGRPVPRTQQSPQTKGRQICAGLSDREDREREMDQNTEPIRVRNMQAYQETAQTRSIARPVHHESSTLRPQMPVFGRWRKSKAQDENIE